MSPEAKLHRKAHSSIVIELSSACHTTPRLRSRLFKIAQFGRLPFCNHPHTGKPPSRSTMHDEIVTLRQVLKTALRHGWLYHLPDTEAVLPGPTDPVFPGNHIKRH